MPSSFHPHALRHLTTRSARVRSRSQPLFSIVPGLSSEPSPEPLGGCRCALLSRCLSCTDRRTERQARLAFSRSAGLAHRLSQQSADHVSLPACPARHCSAPWSLCAQVFLQNGKLLPPVITAQQPFLSAAPVSAMLRQEPLPCAVIVPFPRTAAPASALLWQEPLTAVSLYPDNLSSGPFLIPARRLPLCAVPAKQLFRAPSSARRLLPCAACCRSRPSACRRRE